MEMPQITQLATVIVPVSDQDRAIEFYVETLGFEKRSDFRYDSGERWVEVVPPAAGTSLTLVPPPEGQAVGIETRVILITADVDGDHAGLRERGIDVEEIMREGDPVVCWGGAPLAGHPPMFILRDPDRNSLLVVQGPARPVSGSTTG
jgi:catechol 2,3-dioxygenase-like lactoylglutathione lyase family enzyme